MDENQNPQPAPVTPVMPNEKKEGETPTAPEGAI